MAPEDVRGVCRQPSCRWPEREVISIHNCRQPAPRSIYSRAFYRFRTGSRPVIPARSFCLQRSRLQSAVLLLILAASAPACSPAQSTASVEPTIVERVGVAMGSELRLMAWTADAPQALSAFGEVFGEFDRLERMMSVWKAESDVV